MKVLQPSGWPRPRGYANGVSVRGRMIFTAGVVGWDESQNFVSHRLHEQYAQVLRNTLAILAEDDAGPQHIVRMTCYVVDRDEYARSLDEIRVAWKSLMGDHYPPMALVEVKRLVEPSALIEIETTAVVPDE